MHLQPAKTAMPEPSDHADRRNLVESILAAIPGFHGYLEKENRRESDRLQRQWLADRLQRAKRGIDRFSRPLADTGQLDLLPEVDRARGRLDRLIARIRGAMAGYSGFFDLVRVDERMLDRVYRHDLNLMRDVDDLGEAVENLARAEKPADCLAQIHEAVDALDAKWDERTDILTGLE